MKHEVELLLMGARQPSASQQWAYRIVCVIYCSVHSSEGWLPSTERRNRVPGASSYALPYLPYAGAALRRTITVQRHAISMSINVNVTGLQTEKKTILGG